MIKVKERHRIGVDSIVFKLLSQWQQLTFKKKKSASENKIKIFIASNFTYKKQYAVYLLKWEATRKKREFLNEDQIKDWFEFYYD